MLLGVGVLSALPTSAQDAKIPSEQRAQLELAITKFMSSRNVPGLSAAVVENGAPVWSAGFGMADLENFVPATSSTLFRLGSISKPITSTAVMQVWEQAKLDLDAPVQRYCPAFPQKEGTITTRLVLGHLAGIRHYRSDSQDDPETGNTRHFDDTIESGLNFFKNDPLVDKPGNHFHYSTQGYTLAGCALEGASKEKYVDYIQKHIFAVAGMDSTQADNRFTIVAHRTRFYQADKAGKVTNADFLDSSYKIPGGGWLSSADDMARFEAAMLNDRLVKRPTRDLMWTPLKPGDGSDDDYGLGWGVGKDVGGFDVGHSGGQQGTSTAFLLAPRQNAGVVVLCNLEGAGASDLAEELLKIVVNAAGEPRK